MPSTWAVPDAVVAAERPEEPGFVIHAIAAPRDGHAAVCVVPAVHVALVDLGSPVPDGRGYPVLDPESDLGFGVVGRHEVIVGS